MKFVIALWISKFVAIVVNIIDKTRGSSYSGKIALILMPDFVKHFKGIDYDKTIFISGTNGKSTNTNLLYQTLTSAGKKVACNTEGANMMSGVATTLIKNSTIFGKFNKEFLVLEIDERSFPGIREVLPGRHMGISNLQKDQVQRNGDPDFILRKFRGAISNDMTLYLNNEEPRSCSLADLASDVKYYSVAANDRTYKEDDFYSVTLPCPKCGNGIVYEHYNLASIGTFRCSKCSYSSKTDPQFLVMDIDYKKGTFFCNDFFWKVNYNNPFYIYNFALCITIASSLGLSNEQIQKAFTAFNNPANHSDLYHLNGKEIHYLRGKQENPEALQSELDIIAADPRKKTVFVGLYPVTDFLPHYSGSFYFFDCNFKSVMESGVEYLVAFSQSVANDIASRMLLAGASAPQIHVYDTNDLSVVMQELDNAPTEVIYILTNTYNAKKIKNYLSERGATHD